MKTYLECLSEAAALIGKPNISADIKLQFEDEHYDVMQAAADMYAEQSNSHKHAIVRGGVIESQSVPLEGKALKWTNIAVTQITPTEPLPAEAVAQNGRDGFCKCTFPKYNGQICLQCKRPYL